MLVRHDRDFGVLQFGYTAQPQQTTTGTIATVVTGYKVLPTTGTQSFTGTFGTAMYWASGIATFTP